MANPSGMFGDTIVALSTPPGRSGIGVIRMSGPDSLSILAKIFNPSKSGANFPDRSAVYGTVVDSGQSKAIDDGIAVVMRGPASYTGEDVVELSLHGSPTVLDLVIRLLCRHGARPATRGEFTRRAFLNSKLDLVQAEAVIDLIDSATPAAAEEALARLDSSLSREIRGLSSAIKDVIAEIEAYIDFDEEDEHVPPKSEPALREVLRRMEVLQETAGAGRIRREGMATVIVGRPNVGKSTLFNALLDADRVIVTPFPGTTRDPVDAQLALGGSRFVLWDTAGIRPDPEPVEEEGIRRTLRRIDRADLVLVVLDGSSPLDADDSEVLDACVGKNTVVVLNKTDLGMVVNTEDAGLGPVAISRVTVSGKTGEGMERLRQIISGLGEEMAGAGTLRSRGSLTRRGVVLMEAAANPIRGLLRQVDNGERPGPEIVSLELRRSLAPLEELTGERVDEGILERIFERFCVGK